MNYEEKYNEILEWARKNKARLNGVPIEEVLPELAESEDERIRKWLYELIDRMSYDNLTEKERTKNEEWRKKVLTWLEKQKENPKSADSIPSNCVSDAKCEDRWHKVTDSLPDNGRLVLAKDCLGNVLLARYDGENWEVNVYDNEDHYCHNSISKWCEIPSEKQKEQKSAEWDKLQEDFRNINEAFEDGKKEVVAHPEKYDLCKPAEWSEEEKEILDSILSHYVLIDKPIDANGISKEKYISLIKSIRFDTYKNCNSHWKPSEEQMKALNEIVNILAESPFLHQNDYLFNILNGLREELKKLL